MEAVNYLFVKRLFQWVACLVVSGLTPVLGQEVAHNLSIEVVGVEAGDLVFLTAEKEVTDLRDTACLGLESDQIILNWHLASGHWDIGIDAPGYASLPAATLHLTADTSITITVEPLAGDSSDFYFSWNDDESYAGYSSEFTPGAQPVIEVLDTLYEVPADFSARTLWREYGIILDNGLEVWTPEEAFKLWQSMKDLPFPYFSSYYHEAVPTAVYRKSSQPLLNDVSIDSSGEVDIVTLDEDVFVYASPLVVNFDGVKGRYFSKRLFKALLNVVTDFGTLSGVVNNIASDRYGVTLLAPGSELEELMSETSSNFQDFEAWEKIELLAMLEEYPQGLQAQEGLQYIVRRLDGQQNPYYPLAPAIAWTGMNTIEFMGSAFNDEDIAYIHRLILHEKAHFLWEYTFDDQLRQDWIEVGDWFEDPESESGWSTTQTTEFASDYAHAVNPNEDMAESIAYYVTNPQVLLTHAPEKYEFILDRVMHGARYVAVVPEELTFEVYNLFPDYVYPGKIVGSETVLHGAPTEDKEFTFSIKLHVENLETDGASHAYARFTSPIGTFLDVALAPQNGQVQDSILTGTRMISKHVASGWWNLYTITVRDPAGNERYENSNTFGSALYINNPLEDHDPPVYIDDTYELTLEAYTHPNPGNGPAEMQAIRVKYDTYDKIPLQRGLTRMAFPPADSLSNERHTRDIQSNQFPSNGYEEVKHHSMVLPIPNFYPTGNYVPTWFIATDIAGNTSSTYLTEDVDNSNANGYDIFAELRDTVFVETPYPDVLPPELDVSSITIAAEPTNPEEPNGETYVHISVDLQDTSDFDEFAAGVQRLRYILRDPLGNDFHFDAWDDLGGAGFYYAVYPPDIPNAWFTLDIELLLPQGSAPGTWSLIQMTVSDRAQNNTTYNFLEYVHFELFEEPCLEDIDQNGVVAVMDLLMLLPQFGCTDGCEDADVNRDGLVGVSDLILILSRIGEACY